MDAPELAALRELIGRYVSGLEPLERVVPRFLTLFGAYLEAADPAPSTERWSPAALELRPPNLTGEQRHRMQKLYDALLDALPGPAIEYLPPRDDDDRGGSA